MTATHDPVTRPDDVKTAPEVNEGPAAAAIMAASIGAVALGFFTTMAEISTGFKENFLQFNEAVGPLSGKTTYAVIVWLVAWAILHPVMRDRAKLSVGVLTIAGVLFALGLLGTFPTFFESFAAE